MASLFDHALTQLLHSSARSLVHRAVAADGTALIVKVSNAAFPSFAQIAQFKREYAIALRCRHRAVARPLALQRHGGRWTMLLEDRGGTALDKMLRTAGAAPALAESRAIGLDDFFEIALQLCAALEQVHRQGVIHKDINPSNLVWNGATRQLELIDFGIACELPHEHQGIVAPQTLEGTLRYMAPEQTGRMNRRIDYRADFYALGATFYELLAGQPPFTARDPMELVHCQIAREPDWSLPALQTLPGQLRAIVQRLLEKNADRRYQGVQGLQRDLAACRALWQRGAATASPDASPAIAAAPLTLSDQNSRFMVPQTLHGRAAPIASLLAAFARCAAGASELVLVSGYAGIGKSAVVGEVQRPIVARHGHYISGKSDQFQRDLPYAPLIQACQDLLDQVLGAPAAALKQWSAQLHAALGSSLGVMVELLPRLALIVGPTAAVADAAPDQAGQRLGRVFPAFIGVFACAAHPLVLFLDDLQWADAATLRMLELIMAAPGMGHLLCIGAYRDNEVDAHHPLLGMRDKLDKLQTGALRVSTLTLGPLTAAQVAQVVAATVRSTPAACAPLAQLCYRKTAGNPFFLNQFLAMVHGAGHLHYQAHQDCWSWNLAAIEQADYTDNVAELLLANLRGFAPATQQVLQLAASLGNRFGLATLALAHGSTPWHTQQALWPALAAGLIQPLGADYKYVDTDAAVDADADADADAGLDAGTGVAYRFLHDRVQQAAYLLVDAGTRAAHHLRIGRLLHQHTAPTHVEAILFTIVEHLNGGRALIDDSAERLALAHLNLRAGTKARRAAAFQATLAHMRTGLALLPADGAVAHADLWRALQLGAAEAAYLCGRFDEAEAIYPLVRAHSPTALLQARCIAVQAHQYQLQGRLADAIVVLREGLAQLGIALEPDAASHQARFDAIFADIGTRFGAREAASWLRADDMHAPHALAAMQMMQGLWMASYYAGQQDLSALMVVSMTRLSMEQGSSDFSAVAYVGYALMLALHGGNRHGGDSGGAYAFGAMALALARSRANLQTRTLTGLMFAALISHWTRALRQSDLLYDEAFGWALEIADFVQVGVVVAVRATERIILGDYLPDLLQATETDLALMRANGQQAMADCCVAAAIEPIRCLIGTSDDQAGLREARFLADYGHSRLYRAYYLQGKIRTAYLFDSADAEDMAGQLDTVTAIMRGQAKVVETTFYATLIYLRAWRRDPARADAATLAQRVDVLQARLAGWAVRGADHSGAKHLLVQAELARNRRDLALATALYQQAIDGAGLAGYVNIQALANELCGACWLDQGQPRVAALFFGDAIAHYGQWGAAAKVAQLRACHAALLTASSAAGGQPPSLMQPHTQTHTQTQERSGPHTHDASTLDLVSLLKAAQTLSNEVGLRNVLTRLIAIVRENAGGQVARLLLLHDGACRLEADSDGDVVSVLQARPLDLDAASDPQFPLSLLRYVIRTGAEVIEDRIADSARFGRDPYVRHAGVRAVMCLPIHHGGRVAGVLYFENRLADASFTAQRVAFLRMLGVQAMISIASARVHDSLELRVAERTAQLEDANRQLAALSRTDGLTGLPNRRHFDEVLRAEAARSSRAGQPLAVIMLDVDYFKRFNDHYGHQAGDACLIAVAHALAAASRRGGDLTARYGGEEFSVVLPNTDADHAHAIGATLRRAVADLHIAHASADAGQVTISVGIAVQGGPDPIDPDSLLRLADAALYRAKASGRNCVVVSQTTLEESKSL